MIMSGKRRNLSDSASLAEQINQVYLNEPGGLAATIVNAIILAVVQWSQVSRTLLIGWLIAILGVTALRLWIHFRVFHYPVKPEESVRSSRIFRGGIFLSGLAWGSAGFLFFVGVDDAHRIFTAFVLGGMVAGAAAIFSPLKAGFPAFALPAVIPIFLCSLLERGVIHEAMAFMFLVFGITMWFTSKRVQSTTWATIRLRFENGNLVETLSRAVEELRMHHGQLEAKVAERTEELSRSNDGLRHALEEKTRIKEERRLLEERLQVARKMEALATLAGGVAHDFNNLLMGIAGQLAILMDSRAPGDPDFDRLVAMERRVREGADLTRQLLGIARGGKYEALPTDFNLLVEKIGTLFGRTHKEILVHTTLAPGLWTVEVDRGQMEHAILNICINAMQAMPKGGSLSLRTGNVTVTGARARSFDVEPGDFAMVEISDTGLGMDKTTLARIFDPFFTTKEMAHGTGLGLSSAYGITRNHGGFIDVRSERGKGSTFSVFLPRSQAFAEGGIPVRAVPISSGGKTVLLVDDERILVEVTALMLAKLGYRVYQALGGEAALEIFNRNRDDIDLVILDMIMPGMGGGETFRLLKEIDPSVKVLLSSGYSIEGQAQELIQEGCLGFLQKPYNLSGLGAKLEEVLGQNVR
jgi:signal transduction histidine kinase/ActR/RegA family two-component response regulator